MGDRRGGTRSVMGGVPFDLGRSQTAVAVQHDDGSWSGWVEPLADAIWLNTVGSRPRRNAQTVLRQSRSARTCATGQPTAITA